MNSVIIATKNKGKAKEFERLFSKHGMEVKTLLDFPNVLDIEETGDTFEENAIIKAEAIASITESIVVADDSGLVIDALDGRPGIYSARYAGAGKNDEDNIDKVLNEMEAINVEERTARFYCALAIAGPGFKTITVNGTCEGLILNERRGSQGFGYDPIFFVPAEGKTMAEMSPERKNELSHRAAAMKRLEPFIEKILSNYSR